MKIILQLITVVSLFITTTSYCLADLEDITSNVNQYGITIPGTNCKTRTNNEATIRNLAFGAYNRDSVEPTILNCGFPTPFPWAADVHDNFARADGDIFFSFVSKGDVSDADFESALCIFYAWKGESLDKPIKYFANHFSMKWLPNLYF